MGIFGWSYPPGCSGPPEDYMGPCEVCGQHVDDCECPECPACGAFGDPRCYGDGTPAHNHGLARTIKQCHGLALLEESYLRQAAADKAEGEYWRNNPHEC